MSVRSGGRRRVLCSRIANVTQLDLEAKKLKPVALSAQGVDQTSTRPIGEPQSVVSVSFMSAVVVDYAIPNGAPSNLK